MPRGTVLGPVLRMTALSITSRSRTSMFPVIDSVQYRLLPTQSSAMSSVGKVMNMSIMGTPEGRHYT